VRDLYTDVITDRRGARLHHDRVIYDVRLIDGELRDEAAGSTDTAAWVDPTTLETLPLLPFTAATLGVTDGPPVPRKEPGEHGPQRGDGAGPVGAGPEELRPRRRRVQRFAAYGLVTDPGGRILLTRIAPGYPGAGRWHLPGGGTDHGEGAVEGLQRELAEETAQVGRVIRLLTVSHRHHVAALGPEGVPIDWHGVRAVFRVEVDEPTAPRVTETAGSTAEAAWFSVPDALSLPVTEVVEDAVRRHLE
jgi:ADP-ribose pyrophosphatase YjhB (NUDIX family)